MGLGLYATLPKERKPLGRKLALFLVGLFLLGFAGLMGRENMQIEGVFFSLLAGTFYAAPFIIRSPRSLAHCCLAGFGAAGHVGR